MRLTDFHLLLLEDDPAHVAPMLRGAADAGLDGRLHLLHSLQDAIDFFNRFLHDGSPIHRNRIPSLILLNLEGRDGLKVLEWLQKQPQLRRIVKVGLFRLSDGVVIDRAYQLGINSCLARPDNSQSLAEMFESIRQYWLALNHPPQLRPWDEG